MAIAGIRRWLSMGLVVLLVSLTRRAFVIGPRTDNSDTFFCVAKRKYPKFDYPG
jgi:hypothetical protein